MRERRPGTVAEVLRSLRCFLRWARGELGIAPGARIDPGVLCLPLYQEWWSWMLAEDRVTRVRVKRGDCTYERSYIGPLKRSSAYKEWTTLVAFWRWAAQVDEFGGVVPMCPTERLRKPYRDPNKVRAARRPVLAPTWEEAARCVREVPLWVRPLAVLAYYTGLRVGQARGLTWEDVHLDDYWAKRCGGPVIWVGQGKTPQEGDGRFLPVHSALVAWLRRRRLSPGAIDDLPGDLRRTGTKAYAARVAGLAEGRIAWEVGAQNLSAQLGQSWVRAGVDAEVWRGRTAHAFRKALRTNIMEAQDVPGERVWQAAERLIGHALPGQIDTYQGDRVLMPTMRRLIETIPPWESAAHGPTGTLIRLPSLVEPEDWEALG